MPQDPWGKASARDKGNAAAQRLRDDGVYPAAEHPMTDAQAEELFARIVSQTDLETAAVSVRTLAMNRGVSATALLRQLLSHADQGIRERSFLALDANTRVRLDHLRESFAATLDHASPTDPLRPVYQRLLVRSQREVR